MPDSILSYINGWKDKLSDYEFILWDRQRFDIDSVQWVKEAFECKKYAFAADYIRLYAVYNYGGIYLDTDVEVLKSFDSLLHLPYFIGFEFNNNLLEAATFGAEKGMSWLKDCVDYYKGRTFIFPNGKMDTTVLPVIMKNVISQRYSIKAIQVIPERYTDDISVFVKDYFSPKSFYSNKVEITSNTYSIHQFKTAWMPLSGKIYRNVKYYIKQLLYKI